MRRIGTLLLGFSLSVFCAEPPRLELREGWVRAAPPTAQVRAAYGRLHNSGKEKVVVTGAKSEDFEHASLHEMSTKDGVMKMRELSRIEVPPYSDVWLEPGAFHLMLFDPKRMLKPGDRVVVELTLDGGSSSFATLEVQ